MRITQRVRKSRLLFVMVCVMLPAMTQVCLADMGRGNGGPTPTYWILYSSCLLSASLTAIATIIGGMLFLTSFLRSEKERPVKTEFFRKNLNIFVSLLAGTLCSFLIIGFAYVLFELQRADRLYRERISYPGRSEKTGRKWGYFIAGLTVIATVLLLVDRMNVSFVTWVEKHMPHYRFTNHQALAGYLHKYPIIAQIGIGLIALWGLYILVRTIRLTCSKGEVRRFLFDSIAVYVYLYAGFCLSVFFGMWLWFTALFLAFRIVFLTKGYYFPQQEKNSKLPEEKDLVLCAENDGEEASETDSNHEI